MQRSEVEQKLGSNTATEAAIVAAIKAGMPDAELSLKRAQEQVSRLFPLSASRFRVKIF